VTKAFLALEPVVLSGFRDGFREKILSPEAADIEILNYLIIGPSHRKSAPSSSETT
jgi:hypothetical protein